MTSASAPHPRYQLQNWKTLKRLNTRQTLSLTDRQAFHLPGREFSLSHEQFFNFESLFMNEIEPLQQCREPI